MRTPKKFKELVEALKEAEVLLQLCGPSEFRVAEIAKRNLPEDPPVHALCERYGYGAVMDSAARQWAAKNAEGYQMPDGRIFPMVGSHHTTGPAGASVERGLGIIAKALKGCRR